MTDVTVRVFNERLSLLLGVLTVELHGTDAGTWAVREHLGHQIALTILEDGRKLVRISRDTRPITPEGWDRWAADVEQLRQHLAISHYAPQPEPSLSTVKVYEEPRLVT